ncbi:MAG: hypothetical protein J6Z08_02280 [Elusimicrobiales bacterium]|nr:hypothetical protein [Elusimicrobiales bacterium]
MNDRFEISLSPFCFIPLLVLLLISWRPAFLQSETLSLTTYYPAPYGGYDKLLVSGNAYLAKSSGSFVQWGTAGSRLTGDEGGSIEFYGASESSMPGIRFKTSVGGGYDAALVAKKISDSDGVWIVIDGDFMIGNTIGLDSNGRGALRNFCISRHYTYDGTAHTGSGAGVTSHRTYCDPTNDSGRSSRYTIVGLENLKTIDHELLGGTAQSLQGGYIYIPRDGNMICCKMETKI